MNWVIIYAVKTAVYLAVFYLIYYLFLARDTLYSRNRIYILVSVFLSVILPFIRFSLPFSPDAGFFGKFLQEVIATGRKQTDTELFLPYGKFSFSSLLPAAYMAGVLLMMLKLAADLINLLILIIRHRKSRSRIIRFNDFNTSGFSALGHIFINNRLSPEEEKEVIRHEQNHLRRNHFMDIIILGIIRSLQWFNPVAYLMERSLREIHEYQADRECIESGIALESYQKLLFNQVFRSRSFSLTNSFSNPSMLRKRMIMMSRKPTSSLASLKMLTVLPLAAYAFLVMSGTYTEDKEGTYPVILSGEKEKTGITDYGNIAEYSVQQEENEIPTGEDAGEPLAVAEQMPAFPGGDAALIGYLASNVNYPPEAKDNNIQGRVIVRFCVNTDGSVERVNILRGVSPELDAEAIRVVQSLPAFDPGMNDGKPVPVWYMVPISFVLR